MSKKSIVEVNDDTRREMTRRSLYNKSYTYEDYVFETFGHETPIVTFTNRLLSNYFLDNAMKETAIGVVRDINPAASLMGAVKTNINNFSGTDTTIGLINNQMHAASLYQGAIFNTQRRQENVANGRYITNGTETIYGNNQGNMSRLGSMLSIDKITGRISGELSDNIGDVTFESYENEVLNDNLNSKFINEQFQNKGFYQPYNPYINFDSIEGYASEHNIDTDNDGYNFDIVKPSVNVSFNNNGNKLYFYQEKGISMTDVEGDSGGFNEFEVIKSKNSKSLLDKTNKLFSEHKIRTMVSSFYDDTDTDIEFTDTAKTKEYGNSHGRNLLSKYRSKKDGFDNPYCRTWTFHNQYDRVSRLIRPFSDPITNNTLSIKDIQGYNSSFRSSLKDDETFKKGGDYLADNTVLDDNGFVNIVRGHKNGETVDKGKYKNCMFSIENLAWKDVPNGKNNCNLHPSQRGENGGRIMWFPPYGITFNESVNASWNEYKFIGRGEPVYTYGDTVRVGTLSFYLLVDHPNIINKVNNSAGETNYYKDYKYTEDGYGNRTYVEDENGNKLYTTNKITDDDILRFFAGCTPLDIYEPKPKKEEVEIISDTEQTEEINYTVYVFFPNNYSGHMNNKPSKDTSGDNVDEDFAEYILGGINTKVSEEISEFRGYEIKKTEKQGNALSSVIGSTGATISNMAKNASISASNPTYSNNINYNWFYRVDTDLREVIALPGTKFKYEGVEYTKDDYSQRDLRSIGLNSDIEVINSNLSKDDSGEGNEATFSFVDLYCAIRMLKNEEEFKDTTLYKYLTLEDNNNDKTNVINEENINKLKSILSLKSTKVNIQGCATSQNSRTSMLLANRRASTMKWLINNIAPNIISNVGEVITDEGLISNVKSPIDIHSANSDFVKSGRYAKITVVAKRSEVTTLETAAKDSAKDGKEAINSYNEKYEEIISLSHDDYTNGEWWTMPNIVPIDHNVISSLSGKQYPQRYLNIFPETNGGSDVTPTKYFSSESGGTYDDYPSDYNYFTEIYKIGEKFEENKQPVIYYEVNPEINEKEAELKKLTLAYDYLVDPSVINDDNKQLIEEVLKLYNVKLLDVSSCDTFSYEENGGYYVTEESLIKRIKEYKDSIKTKQKELKKETDSNKISKLVKDIKEITEKATKASDYIDDYNFCIDNRENLRDDINKDIKTLRKEITKLYKKLTKNSCDYSKKDEEIAKLERKVKEKRQEFKQNTSLFIKGKIDESKYDNSKKELEDAKRELKALEEQLKNQLCPDNEEKIIDRFTYKLTPNIIAYDLISLNNNKDESNYIKFLIDNDNYLDYRYYEYFLLTYLEELTDEEEVIYFMLDKLNEKQSNNTINYEGILNEERRRLATLLMLEYILSNDLNVLGKDLDKPESTPQFFTYKLFYENNDEDSIYDLFEDNNDKELVKSIMTTDIPIKIKESSGNIIKTVFNISNSLFDYNSNPYSGFSSYEEVKNSCTSENPTNSDYCYRDVKKQIYTLIGLFENEISKIGETLLTSAEQSYQDLIEKNTNASKSYQSISENVGNVKTDEEENVLTDEPEEVQDTRYEREDEYFMRISKENPLVFKKLTDKFNYFDPAFHSISPEGFNARLTFLQQCMRQGQTLEMTGSDGRSKIAGNLAFGRMPVCVLRIGDFINTRVIIDNISINYDEGNSLMWDINPEGIGVQPMFAKVSLTLKLIGGQSLEGPITKLQNALSFNYYANTGVYDNRSDRAKPTYEGGSEDKVSNYSTEYTHIWKPLKKE